MQFILFVVVLILPALQSGGFLFPAGTRDECVELIIAGGMVKCELGQLNNFENYDTRSCELICNGGRLPMPRVCYGNKVICTSTARSTLLAWKQDLEKTKSRIIDEWCPRCQGK
ncbi:uncharacterized protein LOC115324965 [Ixodes scapularis]|uniref:uncharacterized protein LOC115324965 n=1 Tax=Ixodes scapularis TaxID=6945 RepID=UPI001A9F339E|nr:uncharacterized protein LOC115324965 [Ixodes scapularis]